MSPPIIITEAKIDIVADTLTKAMVEITDDLACEGQKIGWLDTDPMFLSNYSTGSARLRPQ